MTYTNFNDYSHAELRKMAQALNPGEVMAAGDPWRRAADTLKAIRATLTRASTEAAVSWEGSTSDAFHSRMLNLAATINNTASYANDAANTLKAMSEAIAKAKHDMPEEPSGWEQLKDGVGDTVSSLFGGDDEDSRTAIAEQRKLEAAAVMQTLAMHYRVAAPMLKPPPPLGPGPNKRRGDDYQDVPSPDDQSGASTISAVMAGASYTTATTTPTTGGSTPAPQRSTGQNTPNAQSRPATVKPLVPAAPVDSGIKGGTAQIAPKPPTVTHYGPGTGIDGTNIGLPATSGSSTSFPNPAGSAANSGPQTGVPNVPAAGGQGGSHIGGGPSVGGRGVSVGGQERTGTPIRDASGRTSVPGEVMARRGKAFGAGEVFEGGFGSGGRASGGSRPGGGLPGHTGGVVGEGGRSAPGSGAKQAFTEGGSGLGARSRPKGEPGAHTGAGMAPGMPLGDTRRHKKDEEKEGKRPAYLVEDEETWASDKPANPNVVE
ncbi:WXG100 family type VII secretion target [Kitasatospora sp. NPDC059327]|uniref:WXG100 family type VII secretion target n=1 Tax=Kitasatospora sp. NPDC059327 TaxID=3346803 RepID=UPI003698F472